MNLRLSVLAVCFGVVAAGATTAGSAALAPHASAPAVVAAPASQPQPGSAQWNQFLSQRTDDLYQLSVPVLACIQTQGVVNLPSPLFHGCYDWHSGVHAFYALYDIARHTGNDIFSLAANNDLKPELVPAELQYMRFAVVHNTSDNPYGFAWLLRVERELEITTGNTTLRPLADYAAQQIANGIQALDTATAQKDILSSEYANLSWAVLNLNLWSQFTHNATLQAVVDTATSNRLMDSTIDTQCPVTADAAPDATGFMPPCLLRLAAVIEVQGAKAAHDWVLARLPHNFTIDPIANPNGIHAHALNFSRAFALWDIFQSTQDPRYQQTYANLLNYQIAHPDLWRVDYPDYSHWVAQFGVLAIDSSFA